MKNNAIWLLIAAALLLLPLVSLQAQAGDRPCGRSCTEMAGCCGDDGACCSACKCEKHECCGECREACRLDSTYRCRCHGDGCVLDGPAEKCTKRFSGHHDRAWDRRDGHRHMGHPGPMGPVGQEFYQKMKLQGRIDRELALCGCQQARLSQVVDANNEIERELMHRYFTDRSVGIEQINWQLTQLHRRVDRHTRGMLNPMQNAVFPEHEWFNYSMDGWNTGFHPGVDYVMDELGGKERKHHPRMRRHHEPED